VGGLWSERVTSSRFAEQARRAGLASLEDLARRGEAWRNWAGAQDGCFVIPHTEVLCWA
jgi:hypothetical protein